MVQAQGKQLMAPLVCINFHFFVVTFGEWEMGLPVDCEAHWAWETIVAAVEQGAHNSAMTEKSIAPIAEDLVYQVKAGYAQVPGRSSVSSIPRV
jgi:hypothetical protein